MLNNIIVNLTTMVISFVLYAGLGLLVGRLFFKKGIVYQKTICWCWSVIIVVNNTRANIGFGNLIEIFKISPYTGAGLVIGIIAMIPAISLTMIKVVERYNARRINKDVKWLI